MTKPQFAGFQAATARHLSFSLTLGCPLRCGHCMVATVPARQAEAVTLPLAAAHRFASEMPALARLGIDRVSFTGGEPFLAARQLALLSEAAAASGLRTTVVTACHWAKSPSAAAKHVARFTGISDWHLSTDLYHAAFLDPAYVIHAARTVVAAGARAMLRIAVGREPDTRERAFVAEIESSLPEGVPIALQPVTPVGRARDIGVAPELDDTGSTPDAPCLTTGPLIRHDGRLLPCCSALAETPEISPFATLDASTAGLPAAILAWRTDPLLTLVRTLGFSFPADWAAAAGAPPVRPAPLHPCDFCTALFACAGARQAARAKADEPGIRDRIAAVSDAVFESNVLQAGD